ncbi:LysR family transcriptional regulator [Ruminococcus sp. AF14-10]|nr:LysR family transcriptional regulator [Ruminococcus sp. AF14-10]
MNMNQLSYFVAVVEEGGFNAAAKRLFVSQSTLSYQIKELELELNILLLLRDSRHARPTEAGLILYRRAKHILEIAQTTENELKSFMFSPIGALKVATAAISPIIHPKVLNFFHTHPSITLDLRNGDNEQIEEFLMSGISEIGFVNGEIKSSCIEHVCLSSSYMEVVGTDDFLHGRTTMTVENLQDMPLLVQREDVPAIEKTCIDHGFKPIFACISDDSKQRIIFAEHGLGIAIVPQSKAHEALSSNLNIVELKGIDIQVNVDMVFRNDKTLSQAAIAFVNLIKSIAPLDK